MTDISRINRMLLGRRLRRFITKELPATMNTSADWGFGIPQPMPSNPPQTTIGDPDVARHMDDVGATDMAAIRRLTPAQAVAAMDFLSGYDPNAFRTALRHVLNSDGTF